VAPFDNFLLVRDAGSLDSGKACARTQHHPLVYGWGKRRDAMSTSRTGPELGQAIGIIPSGSGGSNAGP